MFPLLLKIAGESFSMVHKSLFTIGFVLLFLAAQGQRDIIERAYFPNARAKNAAIAAARYAQEGYFYTKYTSYISAVDSSRMYADTALFFIGRSLMLADTALFYTPKINYPAIDFLHSGVKKAETANAQIRDYYPMIDIKSHHAFGREAALSLSNSVMDFYNASLLLNAEENAPESEKDRYAILPYEDEIIRLEVDETSFQQASNAYEAEIIDLAKLNTRIQKRIDSAPDQKSRALLRKRKHQVEQQLSENTARLEDLSVRLGEIRQLLQKKHLNDVKHVAEPEHLPYFETASKRTEIQMDKEVPNGLVYKIQLGYYPPDVDIENFHGLFPISGETVRPNLARFYAGLFYSYEDAIVGSDYVRSHAIANAFVVSFFNGQKISISSAVEMERERGVR